MIIHPHLLKAEVQRVTSEVFVCGPGYSSNGIEIRDRARDALTNVPNVKAIYGEEIETQTRYRRQRTDLQTLEARFAHDVDFTLLILESPGSIAELGTFTQLPDLRERLIVLVSSRFYRAESYIARGPLSLLTNFNPNSVIYYDPEEPNDLIVRILYSLTFYKYAHYLYRYEYLRRTRIRLGEMVPGQYSAFISPIREQYNMTIALLSIIVKERASYADLLLLCGLAPKQLNAALHGLYEAAKVEKGASGRYRPTAGYQDSLLKPFSSTELSKLRAQLLAAA
ncbi:MAG: retron St85 family effector protein [Devosia sp.]